MPPRAVFVTIGQSPRTDVLPEILEHVRTPLEASERGALDGFSDEAISALAPKSGEECLVTRLRDGREVLLGKPAMDRRLHELVAELDEAGFDLIVLLCTAPFSPFHTSTPFIEPQHVVDHFAQGLAYGVDRVGVVLPNPAQIDGFEGIPGLSTQASSASPFAPDAEAAVAAAAAGFKDAGLIVLHCIAYTEAMASRARAASARPVLLSRRLVAHAIDMLLG